MKIILPQIPTYFIALSTEHDQINRINKMLESLQFTNTKHILGKLPDIKYLNCGPYCFPSAVGCALSHLTILQSTQTFPFLILEADAHVLYENFLKEIEIPDECDCLYLGGSICGTDAYKIKEYNKDFYQIQGMYSSHAILHLKSNYTLDAKQTILKYLEQGIPFDVGLAELQKNFTVLMPKKHFFYQSPLNEESTKPLFLST
jgi:hypothetical protein